MGYSTAGLSQEKSFAKITFLWRFANVFSAKIYFKQLDTALVGVVHCASGRGALGYRKFGENLSAKIYFQAICESFLLHKNPSIRYFKAGTIGGYYVL